MDQNDQDMVCEIKTYPLHYQCEALENLFLERTQSLHCYREQVDSLQLELNDMAKECEGKIKGVRRDAIYNEKSRSGKILKRAMLT